jgi:hypothetical protein
VITGKGDGTFNQASNLDVFPPTMVNGGRIPFNVIAADVTTDQKPDLITTNSATNNISVFTQLAGGGQLSAPTLINTTIGATPQGLGAADMDGDGDTDLVIGNAAGSTLSVLLNIGTGVGYLGQAGTPINPGFNPGGVLLADVNKDNRPDIIVTNGAVGANNMRVILNTTTGYMQQALITVGTSPTGLVAADFDGDGNVDLAVSHVGSNNVYLLKGNGAGVFAALGAPIAVGAGPQSLVAADLNLDDKMDLVVPNGGANPGTMHVLIGRGDGTFSLAGGNPVVIGREAFSATVADFNKDGKPDIAVTRYGMAVAPGGIDILLNSGQ